MPVEPPTCPAFLGTKARAEWQRIVPLMITAGLLTQLDRAMLAAYCQAWGEWADLCELVKAKMADVDDGGKPRGADVLIDMTPSGYRQVSALAQARDRAFDRLMRTAREFGLSAASRVQATAGQQLALPGVADPMEAFLAAGNPVAAAAAGVAPLLAQTTTDRDTPAEPPGTA